MLIAFAGLPGTGKSALARGLAAALPATVLDKDRVRAALFAPEDIEHSTAQDDFCIGIMLEVATYLWQKRPGRAIILDGRPFVTRAQREAVAAFARAQGVPYRLILCVCAEETARRRLERDAASGAHPARNRDHDLYLALKRAFAPLDGPHLLVDTDQEYAACLERCLAYCRAS